MQEGFFSTSEIKSLTKRNPLPPILKLQIPTLPPAKIKIPEIPKHPQMFLDIECYINYFLIKFRRLSDNELFYFEQIDELGVVLDKRGLWDLISKYEIITFNGNKYDILMLRLALKGASNKKLKEASDLLIDTEGEDEDNEYRFNFEHIHKLPDFKIKHIDLIELLPGHMISLKIYGGRLHCKKLQDLPIEPNEVLTEDDMDDINTYCGNDLDVTQLLYINQLEQIDLRRTMTQRYGVDLLSKSDAQIAEAVIKAEVCKLAKKTKIEKSQYKSNSFFYEPPKYIQFINPILKRALEITKTQEFTISNSGKVVVPKDLASLKIKIGSSVYQMGGGGLHSTEKSIFHIANDLCSLWDWDADSFYPRIIINGKLTPKNMKPHFLPVYTRIVEERLQAKANKDKVKANSLKIVINGSFGKFGSKYSILYAPELMIQVTVTGQLSLLMLIDMMENAGIPAISGNTDGVVLKCPKNKEELMHKIIKDFEIRTGFNMSSAQYAGVYSRDVNNYIAFHTNGEIKRKGVFRAPAIDKSPDCEVCTDAMIEYITKGTPFIETIKACKDVRKFVSLRSVTGGAVKDGRYLGKAIRWYHARGERGSINYKENGNQVPMTEGVKPIMNMSGTLPDDIDYDWYEEKCYDLFYTKGNG